MWIQASKVSSQAIDQKAREPKHLFLYPRANYEVTFNAPNGQFLQSQLALLLHVPSRDTVSNFKSIEIFLSPNACEGAPEPTVSEAHLLSNGWKLCRMGTVPERSYALKY
jgi:hypothetical protein